MIENFSSWLKSKVYRNFAYNVRQALYITCIWILVTLFFIYIKFNDIPENYLSDIYELQQEMTKNWMYRTAALIGLSFGLVMGILHIFVYPYMERTQKLFYNILFRVTVFCILSCSVYFMLLCTNGLVLSNESVLLAFNKPATVNILLYAFVTETLVSLMMILRKNLGRKYFISILKNTYRNPKEEERIFLFLDLEDSTPTAQKMGHLNFSRYIQDCFWDLSDITLMHGAEIYQFVGDEAVITWKVSKNFDYGKCIALYFAYKNLLEQKKQFYEEKYGATPRFRCAIHSGKVSAALVGDYKKEIAYHGNVLNLGSRLQKNCGEYDADILISEDFFSRLKDHWYSLSPVVLNDLKGIENVQMAYKVEEESKKYYFYS